MTTPTQRRTLGGLLVRKECWVLSRPAKILIGLFCLGLALLAVWLIYPFLAVTQRVPAQVMVVEGWIPPEILTNAQAEFKAGDYKIIITSGGVVRDHLHFDEKTTYANWAAADLRKLGVPENLVHAAPCWNVRRDRTFSSALAVKDWLAQNHQPVNSIDVVTLGPHARRTRLLYEEAFGSHVKVGVIALSSPDYDANHWWKYSEGVRDVVGEAIAYVYAKFFFWPSRENQDLAKPSEEPPPQ